MYKGGKTERSHLTQSQEAYNSLGCRVDSQDDHIIITLLKDTLTLPEDIVLPQGEWSTNKRGFLNSGAEDRVISCQIFPFNIFTF